LSALLGALFAAPACADESAEVSRLVRTGQLAEAMARVDKSLAQHPRDPQLRFLKGVILTEQRKSSEAIAVFTRLTEDFPTLPEPYNNLAVLHAANGQYEKARAALDAAIRTNPSYATAYENLGDVHAKLASQAYDKALQIDSGNAAAKPKLVLLRSLSGTAVETSEKVVAAPVPPVAAAKPESRLAKVETEPAKLAQKRAAADGEREEVLDTVNGWAKAWGAKDVERHMNFYANDFQAPNGMSRKEWVQECQSRIADKGHISVRIEAPQVILSGNTATVKFRQNYVSDRLKEGSRKTLVLVKQGGKWQIRQEFTGS
jgi:tetratricopeptide (TPR) repeat protein